MIKKKDIVVTVLLSLITCGIYGIIWFVNMTDDVKTLTNDESLPSGGMALLLGIVTCGIYYYVWAYKVGKALFQSGKTTSDNTILYLVLMIFGLGIVNYCLIQDELNKHANA